MKPSQLTVQIVKKYLGRTSDNEDELIEISMSSAKAFILGYTGLNDEQLDEYEDITIAYLCLTESMYVDREMIVDSTNLNPTVKQILDMHCVNLLPSEEVG